MSRDETSIPEPKVVSAAMIIVVLLALFISACTATLPPAGPPEPVFPLPSTKGGLGGRVLTVTNLNADGPQRINFQQHHANLA
jgi:hypothetical protein